LRRSAWSIVSLRPAGRAQARARAPARSHTHSSPARCPARPRLTRLGPPRAARPRGAR
ncbi:hypothetical protein P7K49_029111, partial [Saguinus oedipus]